jgi:hypothetical protein
LMHTRRILKDSTLPKRSGRTYSVGTSQRRVEPFRSTGRCQWLAMAARRGLYWLKDARFLPSATLSGQTLRSAMCGLMALREMEFKGTHRTVLTLKDATNRVGCSSTHCPSQARRGSWARE